MFSCSGNKVGNPFVTADKRMEALALGKVGEGGNSGGRLLKCESQKSEKS